VLAIAIIDMPTNPATIPVLLNASAGSSAALCSRQTDTGEICRECTVAVGGFLQTCACPQAVAGRALVACKALATGGSWRQAPSKRALWNWQRLPTTKVKFAGIEARGVARGDRIQQ
jgi:hypothetical protein